MMYGKLGKCETDEEKAVVWSWADSITTCRAAECEAANGGGGAAPAAGAAPAPHGAAAAPSAAAEAGDVVDDDDDDDEGDSPRAQRHAATILVSAYPCLH